MAASLQNDIRIPETARLVLTGNAAGVFASIDPPALAVLFQAPVFGVSPQSLAPLWHSPEPGPRMAITLENRQDSPKVLIFKNVTVDRRFKPEYSRWIYRHRSVPEQNGGAAAEAQDGVRPDGSFGLLLLPRESREVELEFAVSLERGDEACSLLNTIDIVVDGNETVQLISLLVLTHPPSGLLDDLPAIYREAMTQLEQDLTPPETPFFTRYLRGFEDAIDPIKAALNRLELLFGPYSTPPHLLAWLAAWSCMPLDENWPEMKRRKIVHEAIELFRLRGTADGLKRFLKIYTGVTPKIYDQPQPAIRLGSQTLMGAKETIMGDIPVHTFTVTISHPAPETLDERIVRSIIESEKPAHTAYRLTMRRQSTQNIHLERSNAN